MSTATTTVRREAAAKERPVLAANYPQSWEDIVGQARAKQTLQTASRAAKLRGVPMPHTLLASGRHGIGKTTLAIRAAEEYDPPTVRFCSGPMKVTQARLLFTSMKNNDILIWDEFHQAVRGGKGNAEYLLNYMQDGVLPGPRGIEVMPRVTIIAATTDAGRLPQTILSRFPCRPALEDYDRHEAALIAAKMGTRIFPAPTPAPTVDNCYALAEASSHNPRLIQSLLEELRDEALVTDGANWKKGDGYDLTNVLLLRGLTPDGLDEVGQRYLLALLEAFSGEPAGAAAMRDLLQEPGGLDQVESLLMAKDYLAKTKQGRSLTTSGLARARELAG